MKINQLIPLAVLVSFASAAPLAETTAVHTKPDPASPAITFLKAGTEPAPMPGTMASTPAGWMAIELSGPFTGYVENKDLTKGLDVKPGTSIRLGPAATAGVLTVAEREDKTTITGLRGRWTEINLDRPLVGYIRIGGTPDYMPPIATAPAGAAPASGAPPSASGTGTGRANPMVDLGDGGGAALPRQFAGRFVSTRRPLAPRRPFDYAIDDELGRRYAYLDTTKLLLTDSLDKYINRLVVVFGTAKTQLGSKDLVLEVESLQLK